jgi:hypothetical protein
MVTSAVAGDLVKGGAAVGEFVLSADAHAVEVFALNDVRHWIGEMTGAKVPARSMPSDLNNTKVFVGSSFASAFADDLAKLANTDGYAIRKKQGYVYVFGSRPRGTMYGLFALLERNTDIIWARPNRTFGTVHGKHPDLALKDADVLDIPTFWYRGYGAGHPFHQATGEWMLHNRGNAIGRGMNEPEWDLVSSLGTNLAGPMAGHFKEHPEYFGFDPLKGGRHGISSGEGTLCLTAPGLAKAYSEELVRQIRAHEARTGSQLDTYLIGPGDNWFCCLCDQCVKPVKLPGGGELAMKDRDPTVDSLFRSTQIFMFLNDVTKALKAELPHVKLAALAYIHMAEPPAVEIDQDLLIYYAPYPTSTMHWPLLDPKQAKVWRERFINWQKKTRNLGFYEYYYSKPSTLAFYAGANLKALLDNGGRPEGAIIYTEFDNDRGRQGIGENGVGWDVGAMNMWVVARLFWNPSQDVDQLYRYYIQRTYREAAPAMLEYYELIKASWQDPNDKTFDNAHTSIAGVYQAMIVKKGHEAKVQEILKRAEVSAATPNSQVLIRRMRDQFAGFSKGLNRLVVANIPELGHDGDRFESVQWEKPAVLDDFKVTRRQGEILAASQPTTLKAAHDGKNLYLRFTAIDSGIAEAKAAAKDDAENFPAGDHGEVWFGLGKDHFQFAFDCNGNVYDAKNYDRDWNSNWRVVTTRTTGGWEGIAIIPMDALGLKPGQETPLKWHALREISHGSEKSEWISYRAVPLFSHFFPIVVE